MHQMIKLNVKRILVMLHRWSESMENVRTVRPTLVTTRTLKLASETSVFHITRSLTKMELANTVELTKLLTKMAKPVLKLAVITRLKSD